MPRTPVEYEYKKVSFNRDTQRHEAKQVLVEVAEYGRWELARTRLGMGGSRTVWLRRKIMRVARTA